MNGNCDVCITADCDDVAFFVARKRKARQTHSCAECDTIIQKNDRYFRVGGRQYDAFWSAPICILCYEIGAAFYCKDREYGNMWEDIAQIVFPELTVRSACFKKLSIPARAFMTARWWVWKESNG